MSYDLAVFDPLTSPNSAEEFTKWYQEQTEWGEPHDYDDPIVSTPALRAWFMDMIAVYPPMNGPFTRPESENDHPAEYSVGRSTIYVSFGWSQAEKAYNVCFDLARKHGVGFFNVSADEADVWFPDGRNDLTWAFSASSDETSEESSQPMIGQKKPMFEVRISATVHEVGTLIVDIEFKGNEEFKQACRKHGITSKQVDDKIKDALFIPGTGWVPD